MMHFFLLPKAFLYLKLGSAAVLWACSCRNTEFCCYYSCSESSHFSNWKVLGAFLCFFSEVMATQGTNRFLWAASKSQTRRKDYKTDFDLKEPAKPAERHSSTRLLLILPGCCCIFWQRSEWQTSGYLSISLSLPSCKASSLWGVHRLTFLSPQNCI